MPRTAHPPKVIQFRPKVDEDGCCPDCINRLHQIRRNLNASALEPEIKAILLEKLAQIEAEYA